MDGLDLTFDPVAGTTTGTGARSGRDPAAEIWVDTDMLLDFMERWEELYRRGEEPTPESLCGNNPALLDALRGRIKRQKQLYALLKLPEVPLDGIVGSDEPLPSFPDHEVLGKIGRGGMGVVYKALDANLGRVVAIKTIAEGRYATRDQLDRFLGEAHAVAQLRHPNIISIHAIGDIDGRPYFSLEFAEKGNLAERLVGGPLEPDSAAELVEAIARAVDTAHKAGIVHRDLKPSNVLLTAEGVPKVSDFGLAKLLDGDPGRTLSGQVLGTPSYMAPEQAEGRSKQVGAAADIYGLGAILYNSLTGRPPFLGGSAVETLKLVTSTEVVPPRHLRPDVPRDLETICLKCLEKSPGKRYESAQTLADDLVRFRRGEPILARRTGTIQRSLKWVKRHPSQSLAATIAVLAVCTIIALTYSHNIQLRSEIGRTHAKAEEARRNGLQASANYQEARSTIQKMIGRLHDRRLNGIPRLFELRRDLRTDALGFYERILKQVDTNDPLVLADNARALSELSAIQSGFGNIEDAVKSLRAALRLLESLRSQRPNYIEDMKLQAECLMKLGPCLIKLRETDQAIVACRESVDLAQKVVERAPDNPQHQELLANCHNNYGAILSDEKQSTEARQHFQRAVEVRERIDPSKLPGVALRLAASMMNEGVTFWNEDQNAEAEKRFRRSEGILLSTPPDLSELGESVDLAIGRVELNWGGMLHLSGRYQEAIQRADTGLSRMEPYLKTEPNDVGARDVCLKLHGNRAYALMGLDNHADAAKEWTRVIELSPEPVPSFYRIRLANALVSAGEVSRSLAQVQLLPPNSVTSGVDCYDLGCVYALAAGSVQNDLRVPADERGRHFASHISNSLRWLKSATDAGLFRDPKFRQHAKDDPDLKVLSCRPEFLQLIEPPPSKP